MPSAAKVQLRPSLLAMTCTCRLTATNSPAPLQTPVVPCAPVWAGTSMSRDRRCGWFRRAPHCHEGVVGEGDRRRPGAEDVDIGTLPVDTSGARVGGARPPVTDSRETPTTARDGSDATLNDLCPDLPGPDTDPPRPMKCPRIARRGHPSIGPDLRSRWPHGRRCRPRCPARRGSPPCRPSTRHKRPLVDWRSANPCLGYEPLPTGCPARAA